MSATVATTVEHLPAGYTARRPDPVADVAAVLAVITSDDLEVLDETDATNAEVTAMLNAPLSSPRRDQWLLSDPGGRAVAWGQVTGDYAGQDDELLPYVAAGQPPQLRLALLDALLARAGARAGERRATEAKVWLALLLDDARWEPLAAERGFEPQRLFARMRRPLDDTLPAVVVPPGTTVRTFDPDREHDWRDFHRVLMTAFRDHWESHDASYADWRARVAGEPQRFDRWWLADDAQLGPVAICQGAPQFVELGGGWVRNLGVLREARGRGIGRCLLLHAMAAYRCDRLQWCGLGVDSANPTGALQLYESVGMVPTFQARAWSRRL